VAGYGGEWDDPDALAEMVVWANEQYAKIAVDTGTDMTFLLEGFCGHGFKADDPSAVCYRGPGNQRWFDDTCIHPNPTGHTRSPTCSWPSPTSSANVDLVVVVDVVVVDPDVT
jgi:hypothetical protein